jgi:hypothetical protein
MKWFKKRNTRHVGAPVEPGMFRLVILDDNPYPTYSGWRKWCSGKPFWEDRKCECAHTERPKGADRG